MNKRKDIVVYVNFRSHNVYKSNRIVKELKEDLFDGIFISCFESFESNNLMLGKVEKKGKKCTLYLNENNPVFTLREVLNSLYLSCDNLKEQIQTVKDGLIPLIALSY